MVLLTRLYIDIFELNDAFLGFNPWAFERIAEILRVEEYEGFVNDIFAGCVPDFYRDKASTGCNST